MMNLSQTLSTFLSLLLFFSFNCRGPGSSSPPTGTSLRDKILNEFSAQSKTLPIPSNNPQSHEKVLLGEALFFDPNLSSCGSVACATCHLPELGFSDGEEISDGCAGATGRRNSNTVYNTAYLSHLFWDGRVQSLEQQALGPIVDPAEMANTWDNVIHYLKTGEHAVTGLSFPGALQFYNEYFSKVFDGEVSSTSVAKAIAAYERSVISVDSPFDRWLEGDDSALSRAQKRGAMVFFGRGMCSECHPPPNFTDSDFHNVGVPNSGFESEDMYPSNSEICGGTLGNVDPGRAEVSFLQSSCSDLGKFKTPTLRNVELSGPYMHNGRFLSLDSVLQHYWNVGRGTRTPVVGVLDEKVQRVMLTDFGGHPEDIVNLTEFLKALTGTQVEGPDRGIAPPSMK